MQISSFSALSRPSSLFGSTGTRQDRPRDPGQFLPNPASTARSAASSSSGQLFSLPRHSLTSAAATQSTSSARGQISAQQAAAAYQSAMNAQGLYGYQATLGFSSLTA